MIHGPDDEGGVMTNGVQVGAKVWLGRSEGVRDGFGEGVKVLMTLGSPVEGVELPPLFA